jgi:hypothetical protein
MPRPAKGDKTRKTDQKALDDMRRTSTQFGQLSTGDAPPPLADREEPAAQPADSSSSGAAAAGFPEPVDIPDDPGEFARLAARQLDGVLDDARDRVRAPGRPAL